MSDERAGQARDIAHELNNWLAAVAIQAGLLRDEHPTPDIQRIISGVEAAMTLVKHLAALYPADPPATRRE